MPSVPSAEQLVAELRGEFSSLHDGLGTLAGDLGALAARVTALEQPPPPPPPPPVTIGERFGGVSEPLERVQGSVSTATLERWALEAKNLGVHWLRGDYPLRQVSPSRGVFDYANTDRWVVAALNQGIKPLPIVYMLPQWMNGSTNDKAPPIVAQDYADWCAVASQHWQALGVEYVEIWNEQNLNGFYPNPDRVRYVDMFQRAATAIHTYSDVKVLIGGLSTADTQFQAGDTEGSIELGCYNTLARYGELGAFPYAAGVGIHPYLDGYRPCDGNDPNWCRWAAAPIQRAIDILDSHSGQHMSVWNTESAAPRTAVTEAEQAIRAGMAFDAFNGCLKPYRDRLGPYFWFTLRDRGTNTAQRDNTFGLMDTSWNPHQAYSQVRSALARNIV